MQFPLAQSFCRSASRAPASASRFQCFEAMDSFYFRCQPLRATDVRAVRPVPPCWDMQLRHGHLQACVPLMSPPSFSPLHSLAIRSKQTSPTARRPTRATTMPCVCRACASVGSVSVACPPLTRPGVNLCTGVICQSPPTECYNATGSCLHGRCSYTAKANGTSCVGAPALDLNSCQSGVCTVPAAASAAQLISSGRESLRAAVSGAGPVLQRQHDHLLTRRVLVVTAATRHAVV